MEVILLDKVVGLGSLGDKVTVKNGYGRNFLIPRGKAVFATKQNVEAFEARRAELEKQVAANLSAAEAMKAAIEAMAALVLARKAGDEGKLFGSVGTSDIADACVAAGVEISRSQVRMPAGAFRMVGEYEVSVHLYPEVDAVLKVSVVGEA